jgi:hypothetical protein
MPPGDYRYCACSRLHSKPHSKSRQTVVPGHRLDHVAGLDVPVPVPVPVPVAMKITGHRTDSMFRRYAIVDEEQKREALAKTQLYLAKTAERKAIPIKAKSQSN